MLNKITPMHQRQLACVYVRQSTIQQVRMHAESTRRQLRLKECAQNLGWQPDRIVVIDEDLGKSAAGGANERPGFQKLLHLVSSAQVGIILAVEISRLAREDTAWQLMFRHCLYRSVLLGDEQHVYDPIDHHDRMMLGLLATFAGFELGLLRERMQKAWEQKAQRGDLFCGCAPGYRLEDNHLVKVPDRRVRHVIETILMQYPLQPSVGALCRWCCKSHLQVPASRDRRGWKLAWREPNSEYLARLLSNPVYAGTYVMGRTQTRSILQPDGDVQKKTIRLPMDKWPVIIHNHHEPYITWEQFERNWRKMQLNSPRSASEKHPVNQGAALLAGLLRCRRCGHGLYVRYNRKGAVRYLCLGGGKQREGRTPTCFSFLGQVLDESVGMYVTEVVQPAGVEAAMQAAEQISQTYRQQHQVLADRVSQCRYESERARRQYDQVEPENRLVCADLERRWNQCLSQLHAAEEHLAAFEKQTPDVPTAAEQEDLLDLGRHLESVWFSTESPIEIKKQIVRLLVEQIVVDVTAESELIVAIHWIGGHHSEHRMPLRERSSQSHDVNMTKAVRVLRSVANDEQIARMLNRTGLRTPRKASWTAQRVAAFRARNRIAQFDPTEKARLDILRQDEVAARLEISPMSVHRLLQAGVLPGEQIKPGLPWIIKAKSLELDRVKAAVKAIHQQKPSKSVDHASQTMLW